MVRDADLPDYDEQLASYHAAFAPELRAMVGSLPLAGAGRVLDVACGDGAYSRWLAERLGSSALVAGLDALPAYLRLARRDAGARPIGWVAARLESLPFDDGTFDLVWCAQSLFSLPDPAAALRRMARVARPGGVVAVLEDDTFHQVLLPWPVEVELAARSAELAGLRAESDRPDRFYVGRRLLQVFEAAGLRSPRRRTWAHDRQAPLDPDARRFLAAHLRDLRHRAAPHLAPTLRDRVESLLDPDSPDYLPDRPDLAFAVIDHVVWGVKP